MSLLELSSYCREHVGPPPPLGSVPETRLYDIPYFVMDSRAAERVWDWRPEESREQTLDTITRWARDHRDQLGLFAS